MKLRNNILTLGTIFGFVLSVPNSQAITINGEEIDFKGQQRISVSCEVDYPSNISFQIDGDNITVGYLGSPDVVTISNSKYTDALEGNKVLKGCSFSAPKGPISLKCGENSSDNLVVMNAGTSIELTSRTDMLIRQCIYEANEDIVLTASRIELNDLFAKTPKTVRFCAHETSKSWLGGFSFSTTDTQDRLYSLLFDGVVNFDNPSETNGNKSFLAIGTNKVTFNLRKID